MSLTTVATVASGILGGKSAEKFDPSYAMAFRFHLEIDGIKTGWQSCKGLKVDYNPQKIQADNSTRYLPGEVSFPSVTLQRAICIEDSRELRNWLRRRASDWVAQGEPNEGSSAKITLFDSYGKPVLTWHLRGTRPSSWSGPDLNATSKTVALETLELVHEGFEVSIGEESYSGTKDSDFKPQPLTLSRGADRVTFLYPPTSIKLSRSATGTTRGVNVSGQNSHSNDNPSPPTIQEFERIEADKTTIALSDLILAGEDTAVFGRRLIEWSTANRQAPNRNSSNLPVVRLKWGNGLPNVKVVLNSVSITYERFASDGVPNRAKVQLTLMPQPENSTKQSNPTSGGIPGRSAHMLVATDNLCGLADATYQRPGRWRAIAAANDMDDPLRLRPGTICYLPAESELSSSRD